MSQNNSPLNQDPIVADRDLPSVNAKKPTNPAVKKFAIAVLAGMVGYVVYSLNTAPNKKEDAIAKKQEEAQKKININGNMPPLKLPASPPTLPEDVAASPAVVAVQANPVVPANSGAPAPAAPPPPAQPAQKGAGGKPEKTPEELMLERRMNSPLSFEYEVSGNAGGAQGRPQARPAGVPSDSEGPSAAQGRIGAGNELGKALTPTEMTGTTAAVLFDRNYLVSRGTFLDCALETEINSSAPGMTSCILTKNVYSANGNLILLDRGSKLTGQYQGGLRQGQARIFVLWTRVETPTGVVINIDSPGTGPLGASGHDGYVDNHFLQRFGGAIMLSLIEDGIAYAATRDRDSENNQTNINFGQTQDATESMAKESLKNTINIPPTLHKNHGDHINVFVARDLDFRTVYGVDYE